MYFSVHGIVGIEVSENYKWSNTLIVNIPMFSCDKSTFDKIKTKIHIIYDKDSVNLDKSYEVVPNFFIDRNNNKFYDKEYGAEISVKDKDFTIKCSQECNEWMMMLLEYALLINKCTFIHSAGVAKDGKAYVFPSWGGVGKTASVAKLVRENGFKLLGDDLVILDENGGVHAFPKKFVLYAYHRELFSDAMGKKKLISGKTSKLASKLIPGVKATLRKVPGLLAFARRHNPQSKRVSPYEIFGEDAIATETAKLTKFIWLERIHVSKTREVEISDYELASRALSITIHELFDTRLQEFVISMCAGCFDYKSIFDESVKTIEKNLKNKTTSQLFMPVNYTVDKVADDVVACTLK